MTLLFNVKKLATWLALVIAVGLFPSAVRNQTRTFSYKNRHYALELPSTKWRAINVSGVARDSTEFRYSDQGVVKMRIRRELVAAGVLPADLVSRQQRSDRARLPGYVKGKGEDFEGRMRGAKYPYEYIREGKPTAGLIYYLQADSRTIYRLEFIGPSNILRDLGNQTDFIVRSFRVK